MTPSWEADTSVKKKMEHEKAIRRTDRLENENKELKSQVCDIRQEYQILKKSVGDASIKSEI